MRGDFSICSAKSFAKDPKIKLENNCKNVCVPSEVNTVDLAIGLNQLRQVQLLSLTSLDKQNSQAQRGQEKK